MQTSFRLFLALLLLCVSFTLGCGGKMTVTGQVTFPDGEPLTTGSIVFEADGYQVYSHIDQDGFYSLGEITPGDGVRPGEYKIKILATTGGGSDGKPLVNHIAPKYENVITSGLTCTVKGKMVHNITVEKP